jgi:NAD(P)-dependent dehydrogenase (short-subunit alcohol dehydrogenase family)
MNDFSLNSKLALITGGGSGIGLAIAQCMVSAGAKVVLLGRNEQNLKAACETLGKNSSYAVSDITNLPHVPAMVQDIETKYGDIDILVNNAGINQKKPAFEITDEEFDNVLNTNLNAVFTLTREVGKKMALRKKGNIIMISSMAAYYGLDRVPAYTASKHAVEGLVKTLAVEWGKYNIRVNAVAPGFIETNMMQTAMKSDPDRMNKALSRTSLGYFGQPKHIGNAVVFLASEAAEYITGVSLRVDGGNAIGF